MTATQSSATAVRPLAHAPIDRIMREKYEELIHTGCTDPAQWRAVHQIDPDAAPGILMLAFIRQPKAWRTAVDLLIAFTNEATHD